LAERQAVTLPTMSNSVTTLVERGWVKRTHSPSDRRELYIELTPEGCTAFLEIRAQVEARIDGLLSGLSPADRDTLVAGLAMMQNTFLSESQKGGCADNAIRRDSE
jgi:DNA-binding MarR family transcriptional regulator